MRKTRQAALLSPALLAFLIIVLLLLVPGNLAQITAKEIEDEQVTAIVQFEDEPLSRLLEREIQSQPDRGPRARQPRQSLDDPAARSIRPDDPLSRHLETLRSKHAEFERTVRFLAPEARVRTRYSIVLNGAALTLPSRKLATLRRLPGVKSIAISQKFRPMLDTSVPLIDAPALWSRLGGASNAGLSRRIAIIDTGIDHTHPFLIDLSLTPPSGFPRGNASYTSSKVIVARTYPPPGVTFTPADVSSHGTHVAGIAAGINGYAAPGATISGVAPKAFLMNYNVFGHLGEADSAQIIEAIEDAVADGADVVNLSLGGPATGIANDPLVTAVQNGISAGVVFAIAAGNSGARGTIQTPGVTPEAITVGASTDSDDLASYSSRGPSVDLSIKPDVVAPGHWIYSSRPPTPEFPNNFEAKRGTSMATPHVAGAAALLKQLQPGWTPAQIKSALVNTSVFTSTSALANASVVDRGAGRIDLNAADDPGLTIDPPTFSFLSQAVRPSGFTAAKEFRVAAESDGAGVWNLAVTQTITATGLTASLSGSSLTVAANGTATFSLTISASADTPTGDYEGYVSLSKGSKYLHLPYWVRVVAFKQYLPPIYGNSPAG